MQMFFLVLLFCWVGFFFSHLSEVLPPAIINVKLARVVSVFPIPSQFMKWGFLEC